MGGSGRGGAPSPLPSSSPSTGGQFLLQLLQNHPSPSPDSPPLNQQDPAIAAVGPSHPIFPSPNFPDFRPPSSSPPFPFPTNFLPPGFLPNTPSRPPPGFPENHHVQRFGLPHNLAPNLTQNRISVDNTLTFGSLKPELLNREGLSIGNNYTDSRVSRFHSPDLRSDSSDFNQTNPEVNLHGGKVFHHEKGGGNSSAKQQNVGYRSQSQKSKGLGQWVSGKGASDGELNVEKEDSGLNFPFYAKDERKMSRNQGQVSSKLPLSFQVDRPGPPKGSNLHSVPAFDIEESLANIHGVSGGEEHGHGVQKVGKRNMDGVVGLGRFASERNGELDMMSEQLMSSLMLRDESVNKNALSSRNSSRDKDVRSDFHRGPQLPGQRMRNRRREVDCRSDIERFTPNFLSIYESLIPPEEEKAKQKQLLSSLEKLVNKEWPRAQLYLYGSCANSFGVSNSDIDVCLAMDDDDVSKAEILLKLAEILESDNLQNVQALTRARVPIVKLMDPVTEISCDICINNVLAVVNTKLLRDYAQIDARLRQLAFIVKYWAKSRGVNETYQGTLSSYAYVLMCIHFLQLRKPAILPCLQEMKATYRVTVDDIECAYFDQVESLHGFGAQNTESIAQLLWAFFDYWANHNDYVNGVISVRTGRIISKRMKDWTRRIGNDRHLICIEDPFETSHDLGRVVDKHTITILRQEFERAAYILQHDPNPSVTLFEPYVSS
ncbi:nucleotidyltransferase family protein [Tasmannia lanceolata]|uniref:nucleotidyltransferase family protein n=1 Tax=Tasmannia lanceolata TaxID=3420 RepID=UPI004062DF73